MAAELRITKRPEGREVVLEFQIFYKGRLEEGLRKLPATRYRYLRESVSALQGHIDEYIYRGAAGPATVNYRSKVLRWLDDVGQLIRQELLPGETSAFAKLMREVETQESSERGSLLFLSSDYSMPWWLARSYSDPQETWTSLIPCGFMPRSKAEVGEGLTKRARAPIALLSRPSKDLKLATDPRPDLGELAGMFEVLDGARNDVRGGPGFGLMRSQVIHAMAEATIIFYYGHFKLVEDDPLSSYFEVLPDYLAGRQAAEVENGRVNLDEVVDSLPGKFMFINACRSVGLPYLNLKEDYPAESSVLANRYAGVGIVCLGTLYPIFDDAAVAYMLAIARGIAHGEPLGECMRAARGELISNGNYDSFDWSSYVLLGRPDAVISLEG